NTRMYVVGEGGQLQPVGATGEMYIGGAGVARGYVNGEEETRERFVEDELRGEEGGRMYRTGDLGRGTEGGELEFVGRIDEQVKIRGYRIEPGEIEQELKEMEGVNGAVVTVWEGERGHKRLAAYVTLERGGWQSGSEGEVIRQLQEGLQSVLPEYMVPA